MSLAAHAYPRLAALGFEDTPDYGHMRQLLLGDTPDLLRTVVYEWEARSPDVDFFSFLTQPSFRCATCRPRPAPAPRQSRMQRTRTRTQREEEPPR